ncbi:hypothetical protein [[Clostridium] colinum]|uniref:hypothetical protein n=1 Tax=[Clostridium] colinum TaxID=36835 RepID=UPI002024E5A0|nr:hypothetical protein [[Clostridium] colinum]
MKQEKNINNKIWFKENNLKIKFKMLDENDILFWVTINNKNIGFIMLMNDFIDWCYNELEINIETDISWNNHIGFKTNKINLKMLLQEVKRFILEFDIKPLENLYKFSLNE